MCQEDSGLDACFVSCGRDNGHLDDLYPIGFLTNYSKSKNTNTNSVTINPRARRAGRRCTPSTLSVR